MTIEEIKDTIQTWIRTADDEYDREEMGRVYGLKSALHLIEKLYVPGANAGDLISRQAVIEWLKDKDIIKTKNQEENARRELAELPSTQPNLQPTCNQLATDCISRQAALKKFTYSYKGERIPDYDCDNFPTQISFVDVRKVIRELPSVEPERKPGKWVEGKKTPGYIKWHCSECGLLVRNSQKPWYKFCPMCGSRMEVDE